MTRQVIHRPARSTTPPNMPPGHTVAEPPALSGNTGMNVIMLIPMLGAAASVTVMTMFRGSSMAGIGAIMMVTTVIAGIAMMVSQRGKSARNRQNQRKQYMDYLKRQRTSMEADEERLRAEHHHAYPDAQQLHRIIMDPLRLWERRRASQDAYAPRVGTAPLPISDFRIQGDADQVEAPDAFMLNEAHLLKERFGSIPNMPFLLPLRNAGVLSCLGDRESQLLTVRNMLLQLCTTHSPEDLMVVVLTDRAHQQDWDWVKWLPHAQGKDAPLTFTTYSSLVQTLAPERERRMQTVIESQQSYTKIPTDAHSRLLIISDQPSREAHSVWEDAPADLGGLHTTHMHLLASQELEPERVDMRVRAEDGSIRAWYQGALREGVLDTVSTDYAESIARQLAPLRLSADSHEHSEHKRIQSLSSSWGVPGFTQKELTSVWGKRGTADFLRVPLGVDDDQAPVHLDLKESAQGGMGPHGLCVGATGSGKSELLRTLVLALMATHGPEDLTCILVDFKGGATFAPFKDAPQTSGVITNLADDTAMVARMHDSLQGELMRRQERLKEAGNLANITEYRRLHKAGQIEGEPMPHLFVCIDEFGELMAAYNDFNDLFQQIGRTGRSLGVHLLLSSQRLEAGTLRGLENHLSYRIALRTFSEMESRTAINRPEAFNLPSQPGWGYLKVDTTVFRKFRASYVSGPMPPSDDDIEGEAEELEADQIRVESFGLFAGSGKSILVGDGAGSEDGSGEAAEPASGAADPASGSVEKEPENDPAPPVPELDEPMMVDTVVGEMAPIPSAVSPVWLPPLPDWMSFAQVGYELEQRESGPALPGKGPLGPVVGVLDDPAHQWQGPWHLDLTSRGGHISMQGGPQSGRSTALRSIGTGLALCCTPSEVAIYGIDLTGSALKPLENLPHVGGVASRKEAEKARRTVEEIQQMLDEREALMARHGWDSFAEVRRARGTEEITTDLGCDVVLLVDGFIRTRDEREPLEAGMKDILSRGAAMGVHVIVTVNRPGDLRADEQAAFGNSIEFALNEPRDSQIDRKKAEQITGDRPGRALTQDKLIGHFALPSLEQDAMGTAAEQATLVNSLDFGETPVRQVRVLPQLVEHTAMEVPNKPGTVSLGLRDGDLRPEELALTGRDQGLIIYGDTQTGRTSVLESIMVQLMQQYDPADMKLAIFDPRRLLADVAPEEFVGGYANNQEMYERIRGGLAARLAERRTMSAEDLAEEPHTFLIVDDYDILNAAMPRPLEPLMQHVPSAPDIKFHVVLARRYSGIMHDPLSEAVRAVGAPSLMLSGDPSEGPVVGRVRPELMGPGRGKLMRQGRRPRYVQTYLSEGAPDRHIDA